MSLLKKTPYTLDNIIRLLIGVCIFISLIFLLRALQKVLLPFAIAFVLAYMINPLIKLIQRRINFINRTWAVIIGLFFIFFLLLIICVTIYPIISSEISETALLFQEQVLKSNIIDVFPEAMQKPILSFMQSREFQDLLDVDSLKRIWENIGPRFYDFMTDSMSYIAGIISAISVILYLIFILVDYTRVVHASEDLIPKEYRETIVSIIKDFNKGMHAFFRAQSFIALIVGILFAIGFSIIDLPLGIILGLFIGVLNLIPYLQILGFLPALLLAYLHALQNEQSLFTSIGLVFLVFIIVQIIQETILIPKFMGTATGMSPAFILLSLSIWGALLGFLGLLIALPITTVLVAYYKRYIVEDN